MNHQENKTFVGNRIRQIKFFNYFERSEILRFFLLSQFKEKWILDKEIIEKEIGEFEEE